MKKKIRSVLCFCLLGIAAILMIKLIVFWVYHPGLTEMELLLTKGWSLLVAILCTGIGISYLDRTL